MVTAVHGGNLERIDINKIMLDFIFRNEVRRILFDYPK